MKISGTLGLTGVVSTPASGATAAASAKPASTSGGSAPDSGALQSAVLQPAAAALREMPEIDQAKVDALRDALAKGALPFDAGKLAGLIQRFHGGQG